MYGHISWLLQSLLNTQVFLNTVEYLDGDEWTSFIPLPEQMFSRSSKEGSERSANDTASEGKKNTWHVYFLH